MLSLHSVSWRYIVVNWTKAIYLSRWFFISADFFVCYKTFECKVALCPLCISFSMVIVCYRYNQLLKHILRFNAYMNLRREANSFYYLIMTFFLSSSLNSFYPWIEHTERNLWINSVLPFVPTPNWVLYQQFICNDESIRV